MKIAVWSGLGRIGPYVTGVGKHIVNVTRGLAARDEFDVRLLLSAEHCNSAAEAPNNSPLAHIPGIELPLKRRQLETLWRTVHAPAIDRWARGADWIYCPKETYVPVRGARYAITVHDLYALEEIRTDVSSLDRMRRHRILKRALNESTVVFAVSEFTKGRIVELLGIFQEKVRVVGDGVEDGFFRTPRNPSGAGHEGRRYVLSVGGLTRKKGAPHLLKLAKTLAHTAPDFELVVTGPIEKAFEAPFRATRNIRHLERGFPDAEMQSLVGDAIASVILSEYEGFGIPALEAMAAGVPVIAARRAALPEVVGDAGILVDPADPRAISDVILALQRGEPIRCDLIEKGRRRARQFAWSACVERVATALEECGNSGRARNSTC